VVCLIKFEFFEVEAWDILYDSLPRPVRPAVVIGQNVAAFSLFDREGNETRCVRGAITEYGIIEQRLILGDLDIFKQEEPGEGARLAAEELKLELCGRPELRRDFDRVRPPLPLVLPSGSGAGALPAYFTGRIRRLYMTAQPIFMERRQLESFKETHKLLKKITKKTTKKKSKSRKK
jgi:hypothetical protein